MKLPGFLSRLLGAPERRDGESDRYLAALLGGGFTAAGAFVSPGAAEGLATVLACVQAISSAIGSLPAYVYRRTDAGRIEDTSHPVNRLIRSGPNPAQTWADFLEWLLAQALLRGNALAEIVFDARGAVVGLQPIPWGWVSPVLLPGGRLAYDIVASNSNGQRRPVAPALARGSVAPSRPQRRRADRPLAPVTRRRDGRRRALGAELRAVDVRQRHQPVRRAASRWTI